MSPQPFDSLPGETPIDKLQTLRKRSIDAGCSDQLYIQTKLNGVQARAHLDADKVIRLTTKQGKRWPLKFFPDNFYDELATILDKFPDAMLYGELMIPRISLAEAAGQLSVNSEHLGDLAMHNGFQYNVFDWAPNRYDWQDPFSKRLRLIESLFCSVEFTHTGLILTASTRSPEIADWIYGATIAANQEGVIYRIDPLLLIQNIKGCIYKRKRRFDMEGTCIGVIEGKGKRKGILGALIVLLPNNKNVCIGGGAGMNDETLARLLNNPPIGKLITFTYEEMSDNDIPLRSQFVSIRDYE